ncbi:hypothetical protein [Sulfuriroseicoccus oceanibius]|uniref:Uncharacterized protein n=1 Tax=Sulfuriroseicoccus oceanibius TaxID=2707525 RepID=A0A6B3L4V5_9BACT|nr:hypothetical protein [Sulfuriroseicoccus oceanibius]QQL43845.1 hypothetical protein G3M56_008030 [Sulfuriroseicoccus oceanibius]
MHKVLTLLFFSFVVSLRSEIPKNVLWESERIDVDGEVGQVLGLKLYDEKRVWMERIVFKDGNVVSSIGANTDYLIKGSYIVFHVCDRQHENTEDEEWLETKTWEGYTWSYRDGVLALSSGQDGKTIQYTRADLKEPRRVLGK